MSERIATVLLLMLSPVVPLFWQWISTTGPVWIQSAWMPGLPETVFNLVGWIGGLVQGLAILLLMAWMNESN